MSKAISESHEAPTHQQIIVNADNHIADLEREREQVQAGQAAIADEREQIHQAAEARSIRVDQARQKVVDAHAALEQQRVHAKLATGTKLAKQVSEPIQAQTEHLKALVTDRDELEQESSRLTEQESARLAVLQEQEQEFAQRLPVIASELHASHQVRAQAHRELGQAILRDTQLRLQQADVQIAEIQKQMDAAQAAREAVLVDCFARLTEWPDLAGELSLQIPLSDPVIRILEAEIGYLNALLADGRQLPTQIHEAESLRSHQWSANQLLVISPAETQSIWGHTDQLKVHRDTLAMVVAQYRRHHLTANLHRGEILANPHHEIALARAFS